jgi:hypothetical protein
MTNPNPLSSLFDYLDKAVDALENNLNTEVRPKEASNSTGGTWEPCEKEACNTTGGSFPDQGDVLNPAIEAQRVLAKVEETVENSDIDTKAAVLLEVAKVHTQIGAQLLSDFDF